MWSHERLHPLHLCMLRPGMEATQLATYLGWLMHGVPGGWNVLQVIGAAATIAVTPARS